MNRGEVESAYHTLNDARIGRVQTLRKKAETILNSVDAALQKIESMPVTAEEKRRLIKEWLRSRLAEMTAKETAPEDQSRIGQSKAINSLNKPNP